MIVTPIYFKPLKAYDMSIGHYFSFDLLYNNVVQYSVSGYKDRNEKVIFSPFSRIPKSLNSKDTSQLLTESDLKLYYKKAFNKKFQGI